MCALNQVDGVILYITVSIKHKKNYLYLLKTWREDETVIYCISRYPLCS